MAKYKYCDASYAYGEPIGFESVRSMIEDEIASNKETDAQQSEDIATEGEERQAADEQFEDRISALEEAAGSSSEMEEKVNELEQKTNDLETALNEKAEASDVEEVQAAIETLNGEGEGSVKKTAEDAAVAEVAKVVAEAPEDLDTLKEVADYIAADKTKATEIETKLSDHDQAVEELGVKDEELAAKDAELEAAIAEKADADALEAEIARALGKENELQGAIAEKASNDSLTEEKERAEAAEQALEAKVDTKADASTVADELTELKSKDTELEAKDAAQDEEIAKKVEWTESTPGRNHIVLKNHDSLLGTATDGTTYNVAMISKWDVADFGSAQLHANLNSKDGVVTINDDKAVATKDEVEAVDAKVEAIDLTPYAKSEDVNAELANKANASDLSALNDTVGQLSSKVDEKAAQSDLEAFEASSTEALNAEVARAEAKEAELVAKDAELEAAINDEATRATAAESELEGKITAEQARAEAKEAEFAAKDEAQDAEIALKADSDKVYTKEDVNNTLEGYVPVEQYNELKARLDNLEIMLSVYNAEREAQMDEIISNMSSDNKEVVIDTLMESIVVPETTVAYTITAPLTDNSTVELTSPKYMTLINTSKEPVSTTISHEYTEGETTAATSVYLVGDFDTLTIENISPSVKSGYDAASVKNVVIPETNVKNLSLALDFQDGATITNNSDKDITINDKNDSAIAMTIVAPNSTVTLSNGQFTELNAEVSDNTLIIKKAAHIADLNVSKGNVIVEVPRASEIAGIVENYTVADGYSLSHRIYHITNENSSKLGGVGEMILDEDITRTSSLVSPLAPAWDSVWNLNGHNISFVKETPRDTDCVAMMRYSSVLEVNGEGEVYTPNTYGLWASGTNAKIVVNSGKFTANTHVLYCEQGTIEVNGGEFHMANDDAAKDDNGNYRFLLNCLDKNYNNGTAKIIVKGGKFYDFDPANCAAEGVGTNFVADGYESVASTETIDGVEHKVYTVKKSS